MRLKTLKIKNFRSYKEETVLPISALTAIVGRNDIGKSTLLEALEIFFNVENKGSLISCDRGDANIYSDDDSIEIACVFTDLPGKIVIDSSAETSLEAEYLLNHDGDLEIVKRYDASLSKPKAEPFFVCNHPANDELKDLLSLKSAELKKRAQDLGIKKETYNASVNADIRRAIRESANEIILEETFISASKEDAKRVYDNIQSHLPLFALFQSDRSSNDGDREIMDPMKLAIKQALQDVDDEIEEIKNKVKEETEKIANKTLDKLREISPGIAGDLKPIFTADPKFDSVFKLSIVSDDDIPMNKRGSGVRRLLLLSFFRAEAERRMRESNHGSVIYAFEEPETSQHPDHQKILVEAFKSLANNDSVQVILTTHTPALAGMLEVDSLRLIKEDSSDRCIRFGDESVFQEICDTLGVLPEVIDKSAKALLLVEGPSDGIFLNHIVEKYCENNMLEKNFDEVGLVIIPIGGCGSLKHWRTMKVIEKLDMPWGILLDSDRTSFGEITDNVEEVEALRLKGIKAYATRKREIENYINPVCVKEYVSFGDYDDAKDIISKATRIKDKNIIEKIFTKMTFDQIRDSEKYTDEGVDHYEFEEMLKDFLKLVN